MTEEIILKEKDIEKFGRKLMKKVYNFLHDKYILSFEEMKVEKDKIEKNLIINYFGIYEFDDQINYENLLNPIKDRIENENLDIDLIFNVLDSIKLDFEIDEDLYCEKKAFKYIYSVFDHYYSYLKD